VIRGDKLMNKNW